MERADFAALSILLLSQKNHAAQTLRAVRRRPGILNPLLPIFVFHERARRRVVEAARDTGATDFITCPISPRTVMLKLEAALVNPRPFIKTPAYFGPGGRARQRSVWSGEERRLRLPRKIRIKGGAPQPDPDPVLI